VSWLSGLSQFAGLMKNLPQIKEEAERLKQRLEQVVVEGDAGAGQVKVRVNGRMAVLSCSLSPDALTLNDREMLEDLIKAATNQALEKARQRVQEETARMVGALGLPGLPPGFSLPGLG
jgi:DNA-binding YbaB/EbfC family protein